MSTFSTIKSSEEISKLFSTGKRFSNQYVTFIVTPANLINSSKQLNSQTLKHDHVGRVAFIAGKKHGNAVWRNSAKRRLREIYRSTLKYTKDRDILFIAKPSLLNATYDKVLEKCLFTLKDI